METMETGHEALQCSTSNAIQTCSYVIPIHRELLDHHQKDGPLLQCQIVALCNVFARH